MRRPLWLAAAAALLLAAPPSHAAGPPPTIATTSNRADLISGGDALVAVTVPAGARLDRLTAGTRDVTRSLRRRGSTYIGLLTGLPIGRTVLRAETDQQGSAELVVTNHPNGGPVFAGRQVQPWICNTALLGLGAPRDAQCDTPAITSYQYKDAVTQQFADYDPASPPPSERIATTTTDQGVTVPYVVRLEKGVMDRGLYEIAVLRDSWNHKLGSPFGGSCNPRHQQEAVDTGPNAAQPTLFSVVDDAKVGKGFMIAHNALGNLGSDCNDVVAAESLMMLQEHIRERYGTIRYTIGYGCSGGSMLQQLIAADYPGLLDGITPACSFPDVWSTVVESEDCHLLERFFAAHRAWTEPQQAAVAGYQTGASCLAYDQLPVNNTRSWLDPTYADGCGSGIPAWNPATHTGTRCTIQDYEAAQLGVDRSGRAHRPYDNIGVEYGLKAFLAHQITAAQFVDLNASIGADDLDWKPLPSRVAADLTGVRNAYLGGRITDGRLLSDVPILDLRGTSNQEIHTDYHSYVLRARLDAANGTHGNQVIWTSVPLTVDPISYAQSFFVMDAWLAAIEKDHRALPKSRKVVLDKPAIAVDSCWVAGRQVTDLTVCGAAFPHYADARQAAGAPVAGGVLACALQPLVRPVGLTSAEWTRLRSVFPRGVCDYRRPSRAFAHALPWATYASGVPVALGAAAPRSS